LAPYVLPRLLARSYPGLSNQVPSRYRRIRPILVLPRQQSFTIRRPSSLTRRRSVRLSSIAEDSLLLPPVGVWAVSQSQCGRSPSQVRSEEHTSELQSRFDLVCRLL